MSNHKIALSLRNEMSGMAMGRDRHLNYIRTNEWREKIAELFQNWEEEILDLSHQTVKLQEELRRRQEVIDKLVYRYTQSEQKVREFIRNTMRYISPK